LFLGEHVEDVFSNDGTQEANELKGYSTFFGNRLILQLPQS